MPVDQSKSRRQSKDLDVIDLPDIGKGVQTWTASAATQALDKVFAVQSNISKRSFDQTMMVWRAIGSILINRAHAVHDDVKSDADFKPAQIKSIYEDLSKDKPYTWSAQYAVLYFHANLYATDVRIKLWRGSDGATWRSENAPTGRTISVDNTEYAVKYCRKDNVDSSNAKGSGTPWKRPEIKNDSITDEMKRIVGLMNAGTDATIISAVKVSELTDPNVMTDADLTTRIVVLMAESKRRSQKPENQGTWGGDAKSDDAKSDDKSVPKPSESDRAAMMAELKAEILAEMKANA
jgi:hypothetical protein